MFYDKKNLGKMIQPVMICLMFFIGCLCLCPMGMAGDRSLPVKEISVAVTPDYPPLCFLNPEGHSEGWLVDIWQLWSQKTGIKVNFVSVPFADTLKLTGEGKVDVHGGCFYSDQRASYLDYVAPLARTDTHFFFHKNIYGIENLKDLLGFRIGVIKGDFSVNYLREHLPGASLAVYDTNEEMFKALKNGETRVFVLDTPVGIDLLKKWKLLSDFRYYPGKPLCSETNYAVIKKGNTILPPIIKKGLAMISSKEMADIQKRWMGSAQTKTEGTLTIVCDRYYPPLTMLTPSGRAAGILIDVWRLWAAKTNRKIEFVFEDWEDSISLVKEEKADIHSGLFRTPEREVFLEFSNPIFTVQDNLAFKADQKPLGLSELSNSKVGVIAGSGEEEQLQKEYPNIILSTYGGYRELLDALQSEEVLAVYDVGISLQHLIEDQGRQSEIQVAEGTSPIGSVFAGVLKGNTDLLKEINLGISEITDQELQEIEARWVSNPDLRQFSGRARPLLLTGEEKQWLKDHPHIRLGVDPNFMPFEAVSADGVYEGISSSYVSLLSKKLGVNMTPVKSLSWQKVLNSARDREVDVLPCLVMSPERSEFLDFTRPYLDLQTVVVTRKDAPFITDLKALKGNKVAVVKSYFLHEMLSKDFPKIELIPVDDIDQGLMAVDQGKATAFVDNSASILYALNKLNLTDLKIAATAEYRYNLSFGVRKDWPQLTTIMEKALQSISEEERDKIASSWINMRFAVQTNWAFLIKIAIAAAMVIGLILTIIIIWNRRMAREVVERKKAEERFQAIAATTPGAIIQLRFDAQGQPEYLYLSPKAEAFFGMVPEQVMAVKGRLPWHPEDFARIKEEIRKNILAEADMNHVGRIIPREGIVKWIRLNASPSRTTEGELIYNGFMLDITERKLAELEHIRSERKSKAMSQAVEDALVMIDGQGMVRFWNPSAERLFGYTEAEAMGMDFHQIAAPKAYHDKIYKGLKQFAKTGEGSVLGTTTEIIAQNRKGEHFPAEVTLSSFHVDGEWFAVGTVRNITDRKAADLALQKNEAKYRELVENANSIIIKIDARGLITFFNEFAQMFFGYEIDEITGQSAVGTIIPEQESTGRDMEAMFQDIVAHPERYEYNENENLRKNGERVWVSWTNRAVLSEDGQTAEEMLCIGRDITESKQMEAAVKDSQERMTQIINFLPDPTWVIDVEGKVTAWNRAMEELTGIKAEEMLGKDNYEYSIPFYLERRPVLIDLVLSWDESFEKKYLFVKKVGEKLVSESFHPHLGKGGMYISGSAHLISDSSGESVGAIETLRDITESKQAGKELQERMDELERFTQLTVNREGKMIQLKVEINTLLAQTGREKKYKIVE